MSIVGPSGESVAQGLSNYTAADVRKIAGMKTAQVRELFAQAAYDEVVQPMGSLSRSLSELITTTNADPSLDFSSAALSLTM